jgi:CotH kinase protein
MIFKGGNNYALYHKTDASKYVYVPMDFDYTFGNGLEQDQVVLATAKSDKFTANRATHSYLYEKLMTMPSFKSKYDSILNDIITKMFSSETIDPRLRGFAYMLQHEVDWDQGLKRQSVGKSRPWKAAEYLSAFDVGGKEVDLLYGVRQWIALKERAVKLQLGIVQPPPPPSEENGGGDAEADAFHGAAGELAVLQPF